MKVFLSILLLFVTSLYILPVKQFCKDDASVCIADMDDEKEETSKKEKAKELFSFANSYIVSTDAYCCIHHTACLNLPILFHTVETPPPDFI